MHRKVSGSHVAKGALHGINEGIPHRPAYFCAYPEGSPTGVARISGLHETLIPRNKDYVHCLVVRERGSIQKRAPKVPFFICFFDLVTVSVPYE